MISELAISESNVAQLYANSS